MTKIIVCANNDLIREGITSTISGNSKFKVIAKVKRDSEVIELLTKFHIPDILLLEKNSFSELFGYELAKFIHFNFPSIKTICITNDVNHVSLQSLSFYGIRTFISKSIDKTSFLSIIDSVSANSALIEPTKIYSYELESTNISNKINGLIQLTRRELEVARLMCSNMPYKQIASMLNISINTVENIRVRIFRKIGAKSRTEVALYVYELGLLKAAS